MGELKTKRNDGDVRAFIEAVEHDRRREDGLALLELFDEVTGMKPMMWGDSMVGYGSYHYKSKSGQEGDWFVTGFSPRKQNISVYIMPGFNLLELDLSELGKHKTGRSCLYINKLSDIDLNVLKSLVKESISKMNELTDK